MNGIWSCRSKDIKEMVWKNRRSSKEDKARRSCDISFKCHCHETGRFRIKVFPLALCSNLDSESYCQHSKSLFMIKSSQGTDRKTRRHTDTKDYTGNWRQWITFVSHSVTQTGRQLDIRRLDGTYNDTQKQAVRSHKTNDPQTERQTLKQTPGKTS